MIKIAVVGDIGSGKSYIAKKFGYPVFNADIEVEKIYKTNKILFKKLKKKLPKYFSLFPAKKEEIIKAIITNKKNLKKITNIIHPEIRKKMNNFIYKNKDKKIVILDIPLLLENKLNKKGDILVFIQSKKEKIKHRLKKRKNFNANVWKNFKKIQLPLEIKKKKCNFIIKNNFSNKLLKKDIRRILETVRKHD
jgi:dephospho-CoA kinase